MLILLLPVRSCVFGLSPPFDFDLNFGNLKNGLGEVAGLSPLVFCALTEVDIMTSKASTKKGMILIGLMCILLLKATYDAL